MVADVIDMSRLDECTGGDKEFGEELLEEFANLLCEEMARLERAIGAANLDEIRFQAHALKGAGASIGAIGVSETAARLESFAAGGDQPASEASFVELERQASKFLSWYESPARAA